MGVVMIIEEEIQKIVSDGWKIRMTGTGYICFEKDFLENASVCFLLDLKKGDKFGFYLTEKSVMKMSESSEELYNFFTKKEK